MRPVGIRRAGTIAATADLKQTSDRDCCVFHRLVLRRAFGADLVDAVPIWRWHLIVSQGAGPWEPVLAAEQAGLAERVLEIRDGLFPADLLHNRWYSCQGWRQAPLIPGSTGHTFLWYDLGGGWGEVLDSTRTRGPRLAGIQNWHEVAGQFRGGLSVGLLRRPGPVL